MKKLFTSLFFIAALLPVIAQNTMTPELLWQLGRVSAVGFTSDNQSLVYRVSTPSVSDNSMSTAHYKVSLAGGEPELIDDPKALVPNSKISPDGKHELYHESVKIERVTGPDYYPELEQSSAQIYDQLDYRIWDTWNDGHYNHVFYRPVGAKAPVTDIMSGAPHNTPTKPFGGTDEYIWTPDSKGIVYVCKKLSGVEAVQSTNTDLYHYDLESGKTTNLTEGMMGYDTHPSYSSRGALAWLSMARDGYESDKNDIVVMEGEIKRNLTAHWDGTVNSFIWSADGKQIYFLAPVNGTVQVFSVDYPGKSKKMPEVQQITDGEFDVHALVGIQNNKLYVGRMDMNHASEIFSYDLRRGNWTPITKVNEKHYNSIELSKVERRIVKTTDDKDMLVWVIYPPGFDSRKKYPTLLYLQGGPQGALSQFYSFRWNFQVMAAQGYIVVAPNRRGMPGHGVEWNEQISKDWGGQAMDDYLSAIDDIAKEPYVDNDRLGAVGASFGGYSAFYLAGHHEGRFKSFISHCGVFNLESMYGTTEELFFVNWDIGGPYWEKDNKAAQRTYSDFNPIKFVDRWDTPMLIIQGGKDYRVPIGQGQEAFQAAQVRGIKSRFLYFPDENHWILTPHNALVWQREYFRWLEETLKN